MNIDWSKAPEGYDFHFQPKSRRDVGGFYTIGRTRDRFVNQSGRYILFRDIPSVSELFYVTSRPDPVPAWNGEGPPPVGTMCEWQAAGQRIWVPVTVVFSSNWVLVVRDVHPHPEGPVDIAIDVTVKTDDKFRPIRTTEQIAADARRDEIRKALSTIADVVEDYNETIQCSAAIRVTVEAMLDAGYRKCP